MQTSKSAKKPAIKKPGVRSLKIQPKIRINELTVNKSPEIKLYGNWLQELGFHYGKRVLVTTMEGLLIIRVQGSEEMANNLK